MTTYREPVTRAGDADVRIPLTQHVVQIGYENADGKCRNGCIRFLILIGAFVLIGFCFLTWYFFQSEDSCGSALVDNSILYSEDSVDSDVDPCEDFYSHVCGRWNISSSKRYKYMSVVEETDVRNMLRLESYLKCVRYKDLTGWSRFMKETYESCERERRTTIRGSKTVRFVKVMAEPLLKNDSSVSNIDDVMKRIHHNLLQNGLFSWDVALDLKNDNIIQALRLSPPKNSWNGDLEFPSKYHLREYITEILLLLGGDEAVVFRRSEEIANFITLLKTRLNATTSKLRPGYLNRKRVKFDKFVKQYDFIDFGVYFANISLSDSVFVVIDEWEYFQWMRKYVGDDGENYRTVRDFLIWSAIDFFVPYMPKEFARLRSKYSDKSTGKAKDLIQGSHVCVNAVKKSMNFAASSFFMENTLDGESRDMVNDIILHVKNSYRDFLHSLQKRYTADRKWLTGLDGVFKNIEIGVPAHLHKIYKEPLPFNLTNTSFPNRLLSAINFSKTRMVSFMQEVPLGVLFLPDFLQLNGIFINLPLLIINLGILTPPLFDPKQLLSSNYAGLGFVLAHELAHSVDHLAINSSLIQNHLKSVTECLHKQYGDTQRVVDVTHEDFADNVGIRVAYNAFLEHVARHGGSLTNSDKRNFFVHYGQILCEDGTSFSLDHNAHHSPYKHRVNMPLSNFPGFADVFSCRNSSAMNIDNKCII